MRRIRAFGLVAIATLAAPLLGGCATPSPWHSELVSTNAAGTDSANQTSDAFHEYGYYFSGRTSVLLPSGTEVAFTTLANNLGPNDPDNQPDIYLRDLETGTTTLVSSFPDPFDCGHAVPVVSPDGTRIAFERFGPSCHDQGPGIYVKDLDTGAITFVASGYGPLFSPDGDRIAFTTQASDLGSNDTNGELDVYLHDLTAGTTTLVSANGVGTNSGNSSSASPRFSPDGTKVLFHGRASDLVPADSNGADDIFLRDLASGTTSAISTNASGTATANGWSQGASFSPNGAKVAFHSVATDLSPIDTSTTADVYIRDLGTGVVTLVSVNAAGTGGGNGGSFPPMFSPDGTKVAFVSTASNLGPNDAQGFAVEDVYVRDLVSGTTVLVSANGSGTNAGNRDSSLSAFSPDGTKVLFTSRASDLGPYDSDSVPDCDYPACRDVYERDLVAGRTTLVSANADGSDSGNADSLGGSYSSDGSLVLFSSLASDLGPEDTNDHWDIYVATLDASD